MPQNTSSNPDVPPPFFPLSPGVLFLPYHFCPVGYMPDLLSYAESGNTTPVSSDTAVSRHFILISLGLYLILGSAAVILILILDWLG